MGGYSQDPLTQNLSQQSFQENIGGYQERNGSGGGIGNNHGGDGDGEEFIISQVR